MTDFNTAELREIGTAVAEIMKANTDDDGVDFWDEPQDLAIDLITELGERGFEIRQVER